MEEKLIDLSAEHAVLVGLFQYGEDAFLDICPIVDSDSFTDPVNQAVFKCIKHMSENMGMKSFDQSSLIASVSQLGYESLFNKQEDLQLIKSMINGKVALENVKKWAAQIRKLQVARLLREQLVNAAKNIENIKGTESISSILSIAENAFFDFNSILQQEEESTPKLLGDGLSDYLDYVENHPQEIVGISSGMSYYDKAIGGGFRRKTVSLIGARQKTGKSFLALNIAKHVSKNIKIPVLYLDTEMTEEDHWSRILPSLCYDNKIATVTINDVESGRYAKSSFSKNKIREAAKTLSEDMPLYYLNVSGKTFEEVLSIMRRWSEKEVGYDENGNRKDCLIIYDYLKMMSGESLNDSVKEYQALGFMTSSLHNFAVKSDVPILTFVQLNREGIDRESTDVISGSDRILWLVTNFTVYKVKTPEEMAESGPENGNRKLVPISARHGEGLQQGDYINVNFYGKHGVIEEGNTKLNIKANESVQQAVDTEEILL